MPEHRPEIPLRRAPRPSPDVAVDLDHSRRPGVPRERPPEPWPDARAPIRAMRARPAVSRHGRQGKQLTPVYSTATPPRGASGLLRKTAYRYPDHWTRHWTLLLLADRVNVWERRLRKLAIVALPAAAVLLVGDRLLAARR
jgi:hypothetical protein